MTSIGDDFLLFTGGFILGAGIVGSLLIAGYESYEARLYGEAVSHGYAEWVVDQETGDTTWQWVVPKEGSTGDDR